MTPAPLALLWDLDGTLLDTYPATDGALRSALRRLGRDVPLSELVPLTRVTLSHALDVLAARFRLERAALEAAYDREYEQAGRQQAPAMAGAERVLRAARSAGILNLLATHRARPDTVSRLEAAGLLRLLDDLECVSDGHPRKPDPALFRVLLTRHGLAPASVLAVGDRLLDVQAAQAAGCRAALLVTGGAPLETPADMAVLQLTELLPLLG